MVLKGIEILYVKRKNEICILGENNGKEGKGCGLFIKIIL